MLLWVVRNTPCSEDLRKMYGKYTKEKHRVQKHTTENAPKIYGKSTDNVCKLYTFPPLHNKFSAISTCKSAHVKNLRLL